MKKIFKSLSLLLCFVLLFNVVAFADGIPSNLQKYIGKTYWVKNDLFRDVGGGAKYPKFFNIDNVNKNVTIKTTDYFLKIKVEGYKSDYNNIISDKDDYFIISFNNKKYTIWSSNITDAKTNDYEIFNKDPKTIFKWSNSLWKRLQNSKDYWVGMTPQMAIMFIKSPTSINRTTTSKIIHEQWVYDYPGGGKSTYLYFDNGKLTGWQD